MSIDIRMSKENVTRFFVGAILAVGAGLVLGFAALWAALASDAIDVGGSHVIDVHGGSGAWTALGLVIVGSLAIVGGTVAAVVSWIAALFNTWQLEDKTWFAFAACPRAARLRRGRDDRLRRRRPRRHEAGRGASTRCGTFPHLGRNRLRVPSRTLGLA
jgi:hypothetical protein